MELYQVEEYFNVTFGQIYLRPGLFYPELNQYFVYNCNVCNESFYIVNLPYNYYCIFPFGKESLNFLKKNIIRYDGWGLVNSRNIPLYDKNK